MDKEFLIQQYNTYYKDEMSFEDYLFMQYGYLQWELKKRYTWENTLETFIHNIYHSGLLKETKFNEELTEIYKALDN